MKSSYTATKNFVKKVKIIDELTRTTTAVVVIDELNNYTTIMSGSGADLGAAVIGVTSFWVIIKGKP